MAATDDGISSVPKSRVIRRTRFCKECEFSCVDPEEFQEHLTSVHRENPETQNTETGSGIRRSSRITKSSTEESESPKRKDRTPKRRSAGRHTSGPDSLQFEPSIDSLHGETLRKKARKSRHKSEILTPTDITDIPVFTSTSSETLTDDLLFKPTETAESFESESLKDNSTTQIQTDISEDQDTITSINTITPETFVPQIKPSITKTQETLDSTNQQNKDIVQSTSDSSFDIPTILSSSIKDNSKTFADSTVSIVENHPTSVSETEPMTEQGIVVLGRPTPLETLKDKLVNKIQTSPDSTSDVNNLKYQLTESEAKTTSNARVSLNFDSHHKSQASVDNSLPIVDKGLDKISNKMSITSSLYHPANLAASAMEINYRRNNDMDDNDSDVNEYDSSADKNSSIFRSAAMPTRNYVCVRCSYDTTSAKNFLHHQVDCHRENFSIYECEICDYATKYKQKLPRHLKTHLNSSDLMYNSDTSGVNGSDQNGDDHDSVDEFSPTMVNKDPRVMTIPPITHTLNMFANQHMNMFNIAKPIPPLQPIPPPVRRNPRQEVDPGKYVIVNSDKGVKYACSKCTSVYSWRKSLNKHWKEKHPGEVPDMIERAKKMAEVELTNASIIPENKPVLPPPVVSPMVTDIPLVESAFRYTPPATAFKPVMSATMTPPMRPEDMFKTIPQMPNIIGPFITNTTFQPSYMNKSATDALTRLHSQVNNRFSPLTPVNPFPMINPVKPVPINSSVLDLSKSSDYKEPPPVIKVEVPQVPLAEQTQPLDFSMKAKPQIPSTNKLHSAFSLASQLASSTTFPFHLPPGSQPVMKPESIWKSERDESLSPYEMDPDKPSAEGSPDPEVLVANVVNDSDVLQCNRCSFVAKTLVDYSTHMGIHMSKRAYKCAVCRDHFIGVDDLNSHFAKHHAEKILEHREVITKAPPLPAGSSIANGTNGNAQNGKNLTCTTCGFVAKWPAELQKHSVSHSEERPFICMVCGSTYKWKWDLVKHFEKSHHSLPNPYKRRDPVLAQLTSAINGSALKADGDSEPAAKKQRISDNNANFLMARYLSSDISHGDKAEFIENLINNNQEKLAELQNFSSDVKPKSRPQYGRPISENTQKAVSEALRQKLSQTPTMPQRPIPLPTLTIPQVTSPPVPELTIPKPGTPSTPVMNHDSESQGSDSVLPYRCPFCEYRARWPSEITQHMKNHSNEKPFRCPRCSYRSKWKWDVVKHLKRCGGGTVKDVIDTTKDISSLVLRDDAFSFEKFDTNMERGSTPQAKYFNSLGLIKKEETEKNNEDNNGQNMTTTPERIEPVLYKAIINGGKSHCLACPFVADTKAELNKHMILHSENKPFSCGSCGYCSKWKGDVKKHLKAYNHTGIIMKPKPNGEIDEIDEESNALKRKLVSANGEEREMFKCDKCHFITSERISFIAHSRSHDVGSVNPKFKCKQCNHVAVDLSAFLNHKISHSHNTINNNHTANHFSEMEIGQQEVDNINNEINLKQRNRRKSNGQLNCPKCPYISFKESNLLLHMTMHEPHGEDSLKCTFCDYNVSPNNTNLLQQHLQLHEAANSNKLYSKQISGMDMINNIINTEMSKDEPELMSCEWCSDSFTHLYQLYEHAHSKHPTELKNQTLNPSKLSPSAILTSPSTMKSELISASPLFRSFNDISLPKQRLKLQCHKCAFVASNMFSYFRHIERHGSNGRHKCLYCDYSIDRLNLLYQHMKGAHMFASPLSPTALGENNNNVKNYLHSQTEQSEPKHMSSQLERSNRADAAKKSWNSLSDKVEVCILYGKTFYKCSKCEYISDNLETTEEHHETHKDDPISSDKYKCDLCEFSSSSLKPVYQHMKAVHPELSSDLNVSDLDLVTPEKTININSPSPGSTLPCTHCPFVTHKGDVFIQHVGMHQYNGRYKCKNCTFSADQLITMNQHSKVHDSGIESVVVRKGDQQETDVNTLSPSASGQVNRNWLSNLSPSSRIRYRCSACPYFTFCRNNLLKHRRQHLTSSRYKCNYCSYSAMRWYLLQQHLQFHISQTTLGDGSFHDFMLDPHDEAMASELAKLIDEKSPMKKANLLTHSISISCKDESVGENKLVIDESPKKAGKPCALCPYSSKSHTDLENHSRHHGANLRYRCDVCSYSQSLLNLILQHRKLHSSEPGFKPDNVIALLNPNYNGFINSGEKDTTNENDTDNDTDSAMSDDLSSPVHTCSLCDFTSTSAVAFTKHQAEHQLRKYMCSRCKWSSDELSEYHHHCDMHIRESHVQSIDTARKNRDINLKISANKILYGKKVIRLKREAKYGFACKVCPERCTKRHQYLHHRLLHRITARYMCTDCSFSVNNWNLLRSHITLHKSMSRQNKLLVIGLKDRVKCKTCPYHVHRKDLLLKHQNLHKTKRYSCEICDFTSIEQDKMAVHVAQQHSLTTGGSPNTPDSLLKVYEPQTEVSSDKLYFKTVANSSPETSLVVANLSCPYCKITCSDVSEIRSHIETHFNTPNHTTTNNNISIQGSGKSETILSPTSSITSGGILSPPIKTKIYLCQFCDQEFEDKNLMRTHEKEHSVA